MSGRTGRRTGYAIQKMDTVSQADIETLCQREDACAGPGLWAWRLYAGVGENGWGKREGDCCRYTKRHVADRSKEDQGYPIGENH